jgi:hypothetical protein
MESRESYIPREVIDFMERYHCASVCLIDSPNSIKEAEKDARINREAVTKTLQVLTNYIENVPENVRFRLRHDGNIELTINRLTKALDRHNLSP